MWCRMKMFISILLALITLFVFGQSAKIPISSCDASSEGSFGTCEYAYEDPDISSWAVAGSSYIYNAWIILYLSEYSDVASFSYRHRYNHNYDTCVYCLEEANENIRVTLSNGYSEDFRLLQQDGDQYFNFAYEYADIMWMKISVLSVYGDRYANGASHIQIFSLPTSTPAAAPTPTPTLVMAPTAEYVVVEEPYTMSYFEGIYDALTRLSLGDDTTSTVVLPFSFPFFDGEFTHAKISSNGVMMAFHNGYYDYYFLNNGQPMSDTSQFSGFDILAFMWTDLNPYSGGNVYYGTCDDSSFALVFADVPLFGYSQCTTTIEIMLYANGNIEMVYVDNEVGATAGCYAGGAISIGIKGPYSSNPSGLRYKQLYGPTTSGIFTSGHIILYPSAYEGPTLPADSDDKACAGESHGGAGGGGVGMIIGIVLGVLCCCFLPVYAYMGRGRKRSGVSPASNGVYQPASTPQHSGPNVYGVQTTTGSVHNTTVGGPFQQVQVGPPSSHGGRSNPSHGSMPLPQAVMVGPGGSSVPSCPVAVPVSSHPQGVVPQVVDLSAFRAVRS